MERSSLPLVVITGITGYLGSQVCQLFLQDGGYRVRGTVRSTTNEEKLAPLKKAFGADFHRIELVEADLLKEESLAEAIKGCDYVVHTASPFPGDEPKDEQIIIKPAVEGTLAVMRAAHYNKVKRVVITSSSVAIMMHLPAHSKELYNESDWSDLKACNAYYKSKTLAEKAAWDFLEALPEHEKFELVTINPSLILGPSFIQTDFTSG